MLAILFMLISNNMKKYIFKILLFFLFMSIIDVIYGLVCDYMVKNAKGGDTGRLYYINNVQHEEILILGSSRAIHHYDPRILEDSLCMSCYNCGKDGNGILTMYPILVNITNRYTPKVIIYEVTPSFDFIDEPNNDKYLFLTRPFYGDERISRLFDSIDSGSRYKMLSSLYKYNGWIMSIVSDNLKPSHSDIKGYRPGEGVISYEPIIEEKNEIIECDELKFAYLQNFIDLCREKNIKLVFAVSPQYMQNDDCIFSPIYDLAKCNNVPILNHYCDQCFVNTPNYFYDRTHMNGSGAEAYTTIIASELKSVIN